MTDAAAKLTGELPTALAAFQAEMPTVAKAQKATVQHKDGGQHSYTYADLADVTEAAYPVLTKHGLSFSACPRSTDNGYELTGMLLHVSGEFLTGALPIYGRSSQEIGSSLTYARRYLLGCMTGLVTDDDDEGRASQGARRTAEPAMSGAGSASPTEQLHDRAMAAPLQQAQQDVEQAWKSAHGGSFDVAAMRADYEQWAAAPLAETDAMQLARYAEHLRHPPADKPADDMPADIPADKPSTKRRPKPGKDPDSAATSAHHRMMAVSFKKLSLTEDDEQRAYCTDVLGREVESRKTLTRAEAIKVIDALKRDQAEASS